MKIISLVGARPQFIKEALVGAAVKKAKAWKHIIIHSGQHYDFNMSDVFFLELEMVEPRYHLKIGSGSHGSMTATALVRLEEVLELEKPQGLIVYGDTNTTLAGALAAVKLQIPVIHVEAGIRQEPRTMPEEVNRRLTDHATALSGGLFACCSQSAVDNLNRENIYKGVEVCGDVMHDLFETMRPHFQPEEACERYGLSRDGFILATIHRDFNVDQPETLRSILKGLEKIAAESGLKVFFPVHPRTLKRMDEFGEYSLKDR